MWKDYSIGFIRKNRGSSISIMVAAFIASLFLSFLCTMFYNLWIYDVEKIIWEEGDWQGRLTGNISNEDINRIEKFSNVERVLVNQELSGERGRVVDLYFQNVRTIFEDLPLITEELGLDEEAQSYHLLLLSRYLIHDPQDESPPLLLTLYLVILGVVSLSLILIIHNSFAVSMNARVRQFGILSSIGASPGQIRTCLVQEAAALCGAPVLLGSLLGIFLTFLAKEGMETIAADMPGRYNTGFHYHPAIFIVTLLVSSFTVLFSAWLPARKLSRLTPLEAIRGTGVLHIKRVRPSLILPRLFGVEGELAQKALRAQKKALRTSTLALTLSFLGFTMMLCFFSLSDLSRKYTYFQRYEDTWDVMVTVKGTAIEDFGPTGELAKTRGVRDLAVYQKGEAVIHIPRETISPELAALGGPKALGGKAVDDARGGWQVKAPLVILDDASFARYCREIGILPGAGGAVVMNQFWDSSNSVFRYREYVPFIKEDQKTLVLQSPGGEEGSAEIPVLGYTRQEPVLKEDYEDYALVQFMPLSLWKKIGGEIGGAQRDTFIRILAKEGASLGELNELEQDIFRMLAPSYVIQTENRIKDTIRDNEMIRGYKMVIGSFCCLLAMIGIANVFSYTSGFLRQRRQELARYMSVGMTPGEIRKMFCVEALIIAGRPILITLPLTFLFVEYLARASYLNPGEVWPEIPIRTIGGFAVAIAGFVILAYYISGKRVLSYNLAEALRDETLV